MKIHPNHITDWLKAVVPWLPSILKALALVVLAWKAPEAGMSLTGLAAVAKQLRP
jgi:hypothetical protein